MKSTHLALGTGLVLTAAAVWYGRSVWLSRHDFITLHVRNATLAEVSDKISHQIHDHLQIDPKLDGKVTLDCQNLPLTNVLAQIAEQVGARWSRTYAVYDSPGALGKFESTLQGGTSLDAAGWTNLAPQFAKSEPVDFSKLAADGGGPGRIVLRDDKGGAVIENPAELQKMLKDHLPPGAVVLNTDDVNITPGDGPKGAFVIRRGGPGSGGPGADGEHVQKRVMVRMAKGADGTISSTTTTSTTSDADGEHVTVTKTGPDGAVIEEDHWSQERLAMVTRLTPQLGDEIPTKASRQTATAAATKVHGQYATYYSLEKPPIGGMMTMRLDLPQGKGRNGTNDPMAAMQAESKRNELGGIGKLTPEQQVLRARQMRDMQGATK